MGFRKTSMMPDPYVIHVCPKCNRPQGDNYTLEDNHSCDELSIVKMVHIIYDAKSDTWRIEQELFTK